MTILAAEQSCKIVVEDTYEDSDEEEDSEEDDEIRSEDLGGGDVDHQEGDTKRMWTFLLIVNTLYFGDFFMKGFVCCRILCRGAGKYNESVHRQRRFRQFGGGNSRIKNSKLHVFRGCSKRCG